MLKCLVGYTEEWNLLRVLRTFCGFNDPSLVSSDTGSSLLLYQYYQYLFNNKRKNEKIEHPSCAVGTKQWVEWQDSFLMKQGVDWISPLWRMLRNLIIASFLWRDWDPFLCYLYWKGNVHWHHWKMGADATRRI